jgi:hypothetical protein
MSIGKFKTFTDQGVWSGIQTVGHPTDLYGLGYVTGHGGQNFRNFLSHTALISADSNKNGYTAFQNKLRNLSLSFEQARLDNIVIRYDKLLSDGHLQSLMSLFKGLGFLNFSRAFGKYVLANRVKKK